MERSKARGIFEKVAGSGIYWIRFMDGRGKYRREVAGSSFSQAKKLLDKRRGERLQRKKLPETLRQREVPFTEACDDTEAHIRKRYAKPKHDLGRLEVIRGWFSDCALDSIELRDVETKLDQASDKNKWSASSYNHHLNLVSLTYRLAIRNGKTDKNPTRGIARKDEKKARRIQCLTADEERRLRDAIRSNPVWAPHEPELDLAIASGLRRSSMYENLFWENIDLAAKTARVFETKNGDEITVPLNADALRALLVFRSRGDGTGRVIRNEAGEALSYNNFWFVPAVRAAGIKNFRWHDCRHTYASRLRQRGVPLGHIAELLGHRGLEMTRRYAHLSIPNLHDAVKLLESNSPPVAPAPAVSEQRVEYVH